MHFWYLMSLFAPFCHFCRNFFILSVLLCPFLSPSVPFCPIPFGLFWARGYKKERETPSITYHEKTISLYVWFRVNITSIPEEATHLRWRSSSGSGRCSQKRVRGGRTPPRGGGRTHFSELPYVLLFCSDGWNKAILRWNYHPNKN